MTVLLICGLILALAAQSLWLQAVGVGMVSIATACLIWLPDEWQNDRGAARRHGI